MTTSNPVSRSHSHTPRRIAVVGGGHLGTIHARLVQQLSDAELVSIVEPSLARANELANDFYAEPRLLKPSLRGFRFSVIPTRSSNSS